MNLKYYGREQSGAKHEILRRYLVPFANKILPQWKSLDFIDGFSGPWENTDTEDLSDTSIGVSLATLSDVAKQQNHTPRNRQIRCIFNEADPGSYASLEAYAERARAQFPLVEIQTFHGEFASNAPAIRKAANNAFQLLFIDPTGYTGFPPSSLVHFRARSSEIIVNFMRSFMERFVAGEHKDRESALIGLVGAHRAQYLLDTGVTIQAVEAEYLAMLRSDLGYSYAGFSPIHNPNRDQIHFNLAFATNHPMGMETMRHAEFKALSEYDRQRFEKKRPRADDLFGSMDDYLDIKGPYLRKRQDHAAKAGDEILSYLADRPLGATFEDLAATLQQHLFLKQTELKDEIVRLTEAGRLDDSWKIGKQRKPKPESLIRRTQ